MNIIKTKYIKTVSIALTTVTLSVFASTGFAGSVFKFKNDKTTSYQDYPPPANLDLPHSVLSKQGVEVRQVLTQEQLRKQYAEREEARKRAIRDYALLESYKNESEIIAKQDDRLSLIDGLMLRLDRRIRILNEQLKTAQAIADGALEIDAEVPEYIQVEIASIEKKIEETWTSVNTRSQERTDLNDKFEADLERFRELKIKERLAQELAESDF